MDKVIDHEELSSSDSGNQTQSSSRDEKSRSHWNDDPTNLIVNYLPVYFTETNLRELFTPYGHIESLIVMYNKHDFRKKSKGYGFVKFSKGEEAAAAIKGVDGTRIANKTIKVSIARPGRARRSSNVFVSRLPVNWRDEELQKAFEEFGHIVECRVLTFGDGVSRRCGFVRYDSDEEAKLAMQKMKNYRPTPRDAPLQVNLSVNHSPDARHNVSLEKHVMEALFESFDASSRDSLDFMPWMARSELYNTAMHRYSRFDDDFPMYGGRPGPMDFASMMHDPMVNMPFGGGRGHPSDFYPEEYGGYSGDYGPRGHGGMGHTLPDTKEFSMQGRSHFSSKSKSEGLKKDKRFGCEDYWNRESRYNGGHRGHKNQTSPSPSCAGGVSNNEAQAGTRLFVQNLPEFYEETHLKQLFSSYGEIASVTIQTDRHGKSIQCGFVNFHVPDDASNALEALDGVMLSTQVLVIHVM